MALPTDFGFGPDEQLLRDQARKFLSARADVESLRKHVAFDHAAVYERGELPGYDREVWQQALELGWTGLAVPEAAGGLGVSMAGIAALVEEVGRHAFPSPLVATLLASHVLREAGRSAAHTWLAWLAEGHTATLAISGSDGSWELGATEVEAQPDRDGFCLEGTACFVQDAHKVEAFLVSARVPGGLVLCFVPSDEDRRYLSGFRWAGRVAVAAAPR